MEAAKDYSKENYVTRDPSPESWRDHANYHIMKYYEPYLTGHVGDLGCNHASCTLLLNDFEGVTSITGIDINENALVVAADMAPQYCKDIPYSFICANLTNLPFDDGHFDSLMSFHTIEHIYPEDIDTVIAEAYRVLKSGGHIIVSIPYDHAYADPCHVAYYLRDSLVAVFEKAGFHTVECFKDDRWCEKDLLTGLFLKS